MLEEERLIFFVVCRTELEDETKLLQLLLTENRKGFDSCRGKEAENGISYFFALVLLDTVSAVTFVLEKHRIEANVSVVCGGIFLLRRVEKHFQFL